jgi:hypothetical protein
VASNYPPGVTGGEDAINPPDVTTPHVWVKHNTVAGTFELGTPDLPGDPNEHGALTIYGALNLGGLYHLLPFANVYHDTTLAPNRWCGPYPVGVPVELAE